MPHPFFANVVASRWEEVFGCSTPFSAIGPTGDDWGSGKLEGFVETSGTAIVVSGLQGRLPLH